MSIIAVYNNSQHHGFGQSDRMRELDALIAAMPARRRRRLRPLKHGKRYTYEVGCRCEFCILANREYCRLWHQEKAKRRIQ